MVSNRSAFLVLASLLMLGCSQADDTCAPGEICTFNADSVLQLRAGKSIIETRLGDDHATALCKDVETPWLSNGRDHQIYGLPPRWPHGTMNALSAHAVSCEPGFALSQFRMGANIDNHKVNMKFQCCPVATSGTSDVLHLTPVSPNAAKESLSTFVNLPAVDCGSEGFIKSWKVTAQAGVDYTCAKVAAGLKFKCSDKQTTLDFGEGLNYLDRHAVHCTEGQVMQRWDARAHLTRLVNFEYRCCEAPVPPKCVDLHTPFNDMGVNNHWPHGQTFYLDRHDVRCDSKDGFALSKFDFKTDGKRMQVTLTCCQIPGGFQKGETGKTTTPHGGDKTLLSRLKANSAVDCGADSVIQNWRITSDSDVKYDCIKPNIKPVCSTKTTSTTKPKGVMQLNKHSVHCPNEQVMTKWDIGPVGLGDEIFFEYTCCSFR